LRDFINTTFVGRRQPGFQAVARRAGPAGGLLPDVRASGEDTVLEIWTWMGRCGVVSHAARTRVTTDFRPARWTTDRPRYLDALSPAGPRTRIYCIRRVSADASTRLPGNAVTAPRRSLSMRSSVSNLLRHPPRSYCTRNVSSPSHRSSIVTGPLYY